ncbi:MAG: DNA translocase FtsK 4TM domain-containing protein, partial [Anaerolineales bacterium]|nr:DNA translocase FtsK 4TM domain-containing protein [Anaerolineales bacterium]
MDIIGVAMVLVGLLTLFGMLSATNSWLMGNWVNFLARAFGWGVYFFPIGLMMAGGWLILRDFERLPQLSFERAVGLVLFLWMLLAVLHSSLRPSDSALTYQYARDGLGGGYVGGFLMELLRSSLGWGGMVIALLAWALLSLAIILDRSVLALFGWVQPLVLRIQDAWDEFQANRPRLGGQLPLPFGDKTSEQPELMSVMTAGATEQVSQPILTVGQTAAEQSMPKWVLPEVPQILDEGQDVLIDDEYDRQRAQTIEETLRSFGAPARVVEINRGPTITQFGVEPDFIESRGRRTRVRVGKIATLADDLALALAATRIRVEAPVPGKGYVGIEVPNEETALVALRDGIETEAFRRLKGRPLRFALGQDVAGSAVAADLAAMPHMLIAGTTGSGKSVCVNAIIACLLMHNTPDDLRMLMVDPKRVELTGYDGIPHLLAPVVVEMERVVGALQWTTREMDQRYHRFAAVGARNIQEFNARMEARQERKLPYLVVIIDELADLMMLAPDE